MKSQSNYLFITISIHLLFWIMLSVLVVLVFVRAIGDFNAGIGAGTVSVIGFGMLVYGHLFWLLPKYFKTQKYLFYILGLLGLVLLTSLFRFFIGQVLVNYMDWNLETAFTPSFFGTMFFSGFFILMLSLPLWLVDNWFKKGELEQELKTYQLEAELRFLKAQVNPHFLFNALNNIYSLSFTQSQKTPEMILKLSDMMSYMLYDCKSEQVKLSAEIEYLQNYIELQQLKKDGEYNIEFKISGKSNNIYITPMLFIPFFENAFKHGNLNNTKKGWMKSFLKVENDILRFEMSNSFEEKQTNSIKSGVGLENVRERLLLLFPNRHQLHIQSDENIFKVDLTLKLASERVSSIA